MNIKNFIGYTTAALAVFVAAPAAAQSGECTVDSDCPSGFSCEEISYGYCNDCAEPAPGEEMAPDCGCFDETTTYCEAPPPKQCDSNSDCDGDTVCVSYTFESCSGSGSIRPECPPDEPCDGDSQPAPDEEFECTTETEAYCVPRYFAPCQTASDCGPGFTCEEIEICSCSGGAAPHDPENPDGEMEPIEEDCSCEPIDEKYCELVETPCTADADCESGLTCQDFGYGDAPAIACADVDGNAEECPDVEPSEPQSFCAPAGYGYAYDTTADSPGGGIAEATGRDDANVTKAEREEFFPVDGDEDGDGSKSDPRGCSTAGGSADATLLLLIAAGFLMRRQRRRSII